MAVILALLGGLLYRVKSGWLALDPPGSDRNFKARCVWAIPTGALVGVVTANPWLGLLGVILAWVGGLLPHEPWQELDSPRKALIAAGVGIVQALLVLLPVTGLEAVPWAAAGILQAVYYALCWKLPARFGPTLNRTRLIDWHTAWAEFAWGATLWGVVSMQKVWS